MKKKNLVCIVAALCGFFIVQNSAFATCSNYVAYSDGQVLTAGSLNSLQTNYTNCVNAVLDGDTFTGTLNLHSGADLNIYSDTGTTLKATIDGATGAFIGAPKQIGDFNNLNLDAATTTNAADSILIECGNSACSASNPGFVVTESATAGQMSVFSVTSNVTINLTGAHWQYGTGGDVADAILRVFAINNNGSLVWCVGLLGGRETLLSTDDSTTATDVNLAEEVMCNAAVDSSTNSVHEFGWVRANFDDTGGAAEDLWAVQTGVGDLNYGSADGHWHPWVPGFTGFSADPTMTTARWTQIGRLIQIAIDMTTGTSNATSFTITGPADSRYVIGGLTYGVDNGASLSSAVLIQTAVGTDSLSLSSTPAGGAWTGSGSKGADINLIYEVGPAASFIP